MLTAIVVSLSIAHPGSAGPVPADEIYAVQSRISTPSFQLFLTLADDATVSLSSPLYGPGFGNIGGVYSGDFLGNVLYGTELDNNDLTTYYLVTTVLEGAMRGVTTRVSGTAIGAPNVEGLAVIDDQIYVTSLSFGAHRTTLGTCDAVTGVATPIGAASRNVMIVALAYDPVAQILYGAGVPFGAGEGDAVDFHNLYILDPASGAETLVGPLGTAIQAMTWDADLGLVGAFDRLYSIDTTTAAATQIGTTDFTDGNPGTLNGIYAIGAMVPDDIGDPQPTCGDPIVDASLSPPGGLSGVITATDALFVLQAAVGVQTCDLCVCDVDGSQSVAATDALVVLGVAIGVGGDLNCPACS